MLALWNSVAWPRNRTASIISEHPRRKDEHLRFHLGIQMVRKRKGIDRYKYSIQKSVAFVVQCHFGLESTLSVRLEVLEFNTSLASRTVAGHVSSKNGLVHRAAMSLCFLETQIIV